MANNHDHGAGQDDEAPDSIPIGGRFAKGQTGNPKGRPPRAKSSGDVFLNVVNGKVPVKKAGKSSLITILEATVTQVAHKAAAGDHRAAKLVFDQTQKAEEKRAGAPVIAVLGPSDQQIVANMLARLRLVIAEENSGSGNAG